MVFALIVTIFRPVEADDDEVDPLDAYMAEVNKEVRATKYGGQKVRILKNSFFPRALLGNVFYIIFSCFLFLLTASLRGCFNSTFR